MRGVRKGDAVLWKLFENYYALGRVESVKRDGRCLVAEGYLLSSKKDGLGRVSDGRCYFWPTKRLTLMSQRHPLRKAVDGSRAS